MKKILFALPVILLVAAGCNSSQPTAVQTQPVQQTQTTPTQQQQVAQNSAPTPTPSTTPTPTPTTNPSTKLYTNTYGYQLTYSTDYNLEANDPTKVGFRNKSDKATDVYGNKIPADVTIEYFSDLTQLPYYQNHPTTIKNIDDYFAQSGTDKSMYNITSYKNKNGDLVYSFTDAGMLAVYTELIPHNGHYYQISYFKRETGDKLNTDEKQIQQTFKFTK